MLADFRLNQVYRESPGGNLWPARPLEPRHMHLGASAGCGPRTWPRSTFLTQVPGNKAQISLTRNL